MNIEKKRMESFSLGDGFFGHIALDRLAIPESVQVSLLDDPIIPISFDVYGHPNFTEEQMMLYNFKEAELERLNAGEYTPLKAVITYEERIFDLQKSAFDTIKGIEESIVSLASLNEMLKNRSIYHKINEDEPLKEFIIFGHFMLDRFGQVFSVSKIGKCNLITCQSVEEFETIRKNNISGFILSDSYKIPLDGSACPCCGRKFTIDDVRNNTCIDCKDKVYHKSCWSKYRKLTEIDKFTRQLVSYIYKETDYQFELLPNGYCNQECCSDIPWFLFHTIDGDIIMGWRKRVISIEWQKNYKPFDMKELFGEEDVTKWEDDGKRGIHAWGSTKAYIYLQKVLSTVNPNYLPI